MLRYQNLIKLHGLADQIQVIDFSSTCLEGESELAKKGHSRDHRPDKPQITFRIATGLNTVPKAGRWWRRAAVHLLLSRTL